MDDVYNDDADNYEESKINSTMPFLLVLSHCYEHQKNKLLAVSYSTIECTVTKLREY